MKPTVRILCLSRAVSPITHQSGTVGNESVLNDEPVRTPLGVRRVPFLSGNAIRHRLVRGPAAKHLVEAWGLAGQLTKDELNLLFHGGLRRESSLGVSLSRTAEMERLFPMLKLLGACFLDDIYPGSLHALRGMLVCRENEPRIRATIPSDWSADGALDKLSPAASFVAHWQYVRGEASKSVPELKPSNAEALDADANRGSDMMPFAGTCVISGAEFLHGFVVRCADDLALGCLFSSMERWQSDGATIGGQGARGHGILALSYHAPGLDVDRCISAYREHVESRRVEGTALLHSLYHVAPKRPKKAKAAKSETREAAEVVDE